MERISSNWTLFYKFFIPTFWTAFFGALTAVSLFADYSYVGNMPRSTFQWVAGLIFLSGLATLLLTLMRLKRVELGPDTVYVTNYFKHYRYPYANVERLEVGRFLLLNPATLHLKEKGRFGKRITFLAMPRRVRGFLDNHPEVKAQLPTEGLRP